MQNTNRKVFDNLVSRTKIYLVIIFLLLLFISIQFNNLILPSILIFAAIIGYTYFANNKRKSEISETLQDLTLTVDSTAKSSLINSPFPLLILETNGNIVWKSSSFVTEFQHIDVNDYIDECVSIGDFILTGGELGSMVISDAIIRLIDGAISSESIIEESFENGLLEYPQFTEPFDYDGKEVPSILYSGNHEAIAKWRQKESLKLTKSLRPDLFNKYEFSKKDLKLLKEIENNEIGKWEIDAINKGHKFIKK